MDVHEVIFSAEKKKPLKIGNQEYFSANDFSLTEKEIEKAQKELHETEEKKVRKLQELRDTLAKDKDVNYRTDTPYLLRFLRIRKYDSTRAYQNIKEIYAFKKKFPETSYIPPNIEQLLNLNMSMYFPYTDENGNILLFFDVEKWNLQETSFSDMLHITNKISNLISMNPRLQVNGGIAIWNVKGFSLQHLTSLCSNFGPKGYIFYVRAMYPVRVKKIIAINTGPLSRQFYKMVRPFLSKKHADRIHLLGSDMKELHKLVNPALLPKKLGGSIDDQYSVTQNVLDNISYLKYDNTFI